MLDMTFQLLTFFIITYHPSASEGQLDVSLPGAGAYRNTVAEAVTAETVPDIHAELKSQLTVRLTVQRDGRNNGALSAVVFQPTGGNPIALANLKSLANYLKEQRQSGDLSPAHDIQIQAESQLKYAFVMEAMDACVKSGFRRIGFAPAPDVN